MKLYEAILDVKSKKNLTWYGMEKEFRLSRRTLQRLKDKSPSYKIKLNLQQCDILKGYHIDEFSR
ncbi:hypothetical protein [Oceanotoga phage vB_OteS-UFV02]